ncbi:NACHT and WD repeat domain-containing protein [Streptomyces sp. NPDC056257]|uniref:NACHT and WD repeat domain-containing protein n=1 Tax=Streptomyces sp. NPDC056257 TaxID=3345765 RepID=UPI0035E15204
MSGTTEGRGAPGLMVLSIGVGSFAEGSELEDLGFVRSRVEEVQRAFKEFEATGVTSLDRSEGEIDALLRKWILDERGSTGTLVVHLIGHGRPDRSDRLSLVAHDDRDVDVDRWIEKAQQEAERSGDQRRVVFLVDTCSAGTATGRQPINELDGKRGVWTLGASVSSSPTERGRFSGWIAAALDKLCYGDFAPGIEAIEFTWFVRELLTQVRADSTWRRVSLGFSVEQGDTEWPFLPNPRTLERTPEQLQLQRRSLGYVPGEDLGEQIAAGEAITDGLYFIDRASGRGLFSTDHSTGFFSGRAAELEHYRTWLDGESPLLTVTGAAGAGKSGLLGLVVCAAHPDLRRRVRPLWESAGRDLPEIPDVVAVHARQRSAEQVMANIVNQAGLGLPKDDGPDEEAPEQEDGSADSPRWTVRLLREALKREGKHRLIVVDAVDESTEPRAVLSLVSGLVTPTGEDAATSPAPCRILLGGRREVVAGWSAAAEASGTVVDRIDLDTAEPVTLEDDVRRYVAQLLRASKPYSYGPPADFVDYLAKHGAQRIVRNLRPDSLWGPFLIAGLYVHYLVTLDNPPLKETNAQAYTWAASADLPHLMEAVLTARNEAFPSLRAVLAVLARSRGDGMPSTTLRRCLKALGADDLTDKQFLATLREATPFLRTGIDPESNMALYRIFHQGLADYLRDHPVSPDPVDPAQSLALERKLLSEVVGPFTADACLPGDRWDSAEPYVLRHALGHAAGAESSEYAETLLTDPYFLIRFDPRQDHRAIDMTQSEEAAEYVRLLSTSWSSHGQLRRASDRASVFAFDAHRLGLPERLKQFSRIAREVAFQPEEAHSLLWAEGGRVDSSARFIESASRMVHGVSFSPDGSLLAAGTHSGVHVVETETWQTVVPLFGDSDRWVTCVSFSPDGRRLAFGRNGRTGNVQFWDVHKRTLVGDPWLIQTRDVTTLAFSPNSRYLVVGSGEADAAVWDVAGEHPVERMPLKSSESTRSARFSPDGLLLATGGTDGLSVWRTTDWHRTPLSSENTTGVAFSPNGRLLAAVDDGGVSLWSGETLEFIRKVDQEDAFQGDLAFSSDGSLLAIGSWNSLDVIEVKSGRTVNRLAGSGARIASVMFHPSSPTSLVSGDSRGRIRLHTLTQGGGVPQLTQFDSEAATCSPDGRLIALINETTSCLELRDPATGRGAPLDLPRQRGSWLTFSPDSQLLTVSAYRDVLTLVRTGSLPPPPAEVLRMGGVLASSAPSAFSPDSRLLALVLLERQSETYTIKVWATDNLSLVQRIPLPGRPSSFGFAGPDKLFVTIDGAVAVYGCDGTHGQESSA